MNTITLQEAPQIIRPLIFFFYKCTGLTLSVLLCVRGGERCALYGCALVDSVVLQHNLARVGATHTHTHKPHTHTQHFSHCQSILPCVRRRREACAVQACACWLCCPTARSGQSRCHPALGWGGTWQSNWTSLGTAHQQKTIIYYSDRTTCTWHH
jgi:hypothetical protein